MNRQRYSFDERELNRFVEGLNGHLIRKADGHYHVEMPGGLRFNLWPSTRKCQQIGTPGTSQVVQYKNSDGLRQILTHASRPQQTAQEPRFGYAAAILKREYWSLWGQDSTRTTELEQAIEALGHSV